MGNGFTQAAEQILRPQYRLTLAAHAAIEFLSDTLDWLNPWHTDAINDNLIEDEYGQAEQNDLSLHL